MTMTELNPNVVYSKEGFVFKKNGKNDYSLFFHIENPHIILSKIIDFNLVKLIYDLNTDIYEKVNLKIINKNEATINLLMKSLFEDIGMPQRFSYLKGQRIERDNSISFVFQTIKGERPEGMPTNAELMPIKNTTCTCNILTPHKIEFICDLCFDDSIMVPQVVEKMIGLILFKVFKRVKQFIENPSLVKDGVKH